MKVRILSDLHLEFSGHADPPPMPSLGEDLVVLAGDIHTKTRGIEWGKRMFPDRPVVYVLGNHEFYGRDFGELVDQARQAAHGSNLYLLEKGRLDYKNIRILGCTLWTDFMLYGPGNFVFCRDAAEHRLRDYSQIRTNHYTRRLRGFDTVERFMASKRWLEDQIAESDRPVLVVTHHSPTEIDSDPQYKGSEINAAYHSHLDDLIRPPVIAWIHGHTHCSNTVLVNGIPVISNQRGYPGYPATFSWDFIVDVENP